MRDAQNKSANEQIEALRQEQEKMRKDFSFQESQYKSRIDKLLGQLSEAEHDAARYRAELEKLQDSLKNKDSDSALLADQVSGPELSWISQKP